MTKKEMVKAMVKTGWIPADRESHWMHKNKDFVEMVYKEMVKVNWTGVQ